jgi:hypothetical protein
MRYVYIDILLDALDSIAVIALLTDPIVRTARSPISSIYMVHPLDVYALKAGFISYIYLFWWLYAGSG